LPIYWYFLSKNHKQLNVKIAGKKFLYNKQCFGSGFELDLEPDFIQNGNPDPGRPKMSRKQEIIK
jgi:hypothetical protein